MDMFGGLVHLLEEFAFMIGDFVKLPGDFLNVLGAFGFVRRWHIRLVWAC